MDPNSPVGGIPAGSAGDPLKLNHNTKAPTAKIAPETETHDVAVKSFSSRSHEAGPVSVSIFERAWVQFKTFFTSTGTSIYNFFAGLFGGTSVAQKSNLHTYVKVSDKIDDVPAKIDDLDAVAGVDARVDVNVEDLYKLENDDGVLYNMDAMDDTLDVMDETGIESVLKNVESIRERLQELEVDPNNPSIALVLYGDLKNEFREVEGLMNPLKESLDIMGQENSHDVISLFREVDNLLKQKEVEVAKAFENIVSRSLADVKPIKSVEQVKPGAEFMQVSQNLPAGIPNVRRNACFRISSIQALLALEPIKKLIKGELVKRPGELKEEFFARGWVKNALENLIDLMQNKATPEEIENAEIYLSEIIFGYEAGDPHNLHLEFAKPSEEELAGDQLDDEFDEDERAFLGLGQNQYKTKQYDAASFLELILGTVLNYTHDAQLTNFVELKGVKGVEMSQNLAVLDRLKSSASITLFDDITDLQGLVDANYVKKPIDGIFTFQNIDYDGYKQTSRVVTQPQDVLVVQLDRRKYDFNRLETLVDNRLVDMPADGVLDYSVAHGMEKGALKYGVNSFIRLVADSGERGHYTTYAIRDGKWYHFNDSTVRAVSDEEAQLEMKKAYILMFERVK